MVAKNWLNLILMAALCVSSFIFTFFAYITQVAYNPKNNFWLVIGIILFVSYISANYVIVILVGECIKQKICPSTEEVCQNSTETEEVERYIHISSANILLPYFHI